MFFKSDTMDFSPFFDRSKHRDNQFDTAEVCPFSCRAYLPALDHVTSSDELDDLLLQLLHSRGNELNCKRLGLPVD